MAQIIKDRGLADDHWRLLESAAGRLPEVSPLEDVIVPVDHWRAERDRFRRHAGRIGVWLKPGEDPALIAEDLPLFGVVAVQFPKPADGRGYSTGRLLRERYRYRGELRAIGDVQRDQLGFLWRCGFNAFVLRPGEDLRDALAALDEFGEAYQASVEQPLPLFRRREVASADSREAS